MPQQQANSDVGWHGHAAGDQEYACVTKFTANYLQIKLSASGVAHDDFRKRMRGLLEEVKSRGEPTAEDQSIAGLLLKLKNPKTGVGHYLLQESSIPASIC